MIALKLMGAAFKEFKDVSKSLLESTTSPIVGLFIGMLATAIVQSSSSTTSIIVSMVAAGAVNLEFAVPMILGANIGTSVTSSLLAFGHIGKRKEYRRAVAAATVHDFFNIILVIIILPLEMLFGILSTPAQYIANNLDSFGNEGVSSKKWSPLTYTVKPVVKQIQSLFNEDLIGSYYVWIWLAISLLLLFVALKSLTSIFKDSITSGIEDKGKQKDIFKNNYSSLGWGFGLTVLAQSSSITSSLIVPFVAARKITLQKAFPFLMGANIGTTTTALIAGLTNDVKAGLAIALVHFFFNVLGVAIFFPNKTIRNIPIRMAKFLGEQSYKNRMVGIAYVAVTFFLLPLAFYFVTK